MARIRHPQPTHTALQWCKKYVVTMKCSAGEEKCTDWSCMVSQFKASSLCTEFIFVQKVLFGNALLNFITFESLPVPLLPRFSSVPVSAPSPSLLCLCLRPRAMIQYPPTPSSRCHPVCCAFLSVLEPSSSILRSCLRAFTQFTVLSSPCSSHHPVRRASVPIFVLSPITLCLRSHQPVRCVCPLFRTIHTTQSISCCVRAVLSMACLCSRLCIVLAALGLRLCLRAVLAFLCAVYNSVQSDPHFVPFPSFFCSEALSVPSAFRFNSRLGLSLPTLET